MTKFMLSMLTFLAAIESARVSRVCDDEKLAKFKIDVFEKLTSLAASVLEFTNSNESEKQQVQTVLEQLALRHKLEAYKSLKTSDHTDDRSNSGFNDALRHVDNEDSPPRDTGVATSSSAASTSSPDATSQNTDAITESVSQSHTASTAAPAPELTTPKQCRQFGDECSPKHLEFCCQQFACVRKNKLSPKGRCRYKF